MFEHLGNGLALTEARWEVFKQTGMFCCKILGLNFRPVKGQCFNVGAEVGRLK